MTTKFTFFYFTFKIRGDNLETKIIRQRFDLTKRIDLTADTLLSINNLLLNKISLLYLIIKLLPLKTILISLLFISFIAKGQLDTLVFFNDSHPRNFGYYTMYEQRMTDSLLSKTCHYICFDYNVLNEEVFKEDNYSKHLNKKNRKKILKQYETNKSLLNSKLNQVKVLIIENPSALYTSREKRYIDDNSNPIIVNTRATLIANIHLEKYTSLTDLYLYGNDSDYITELPSETYNLPLKTIYTYWLEYHEKFAENVRKNRSNIDVINLSKKIMDEYNKNIKTR